MFINVEPGGSFIYNSNVKQENTQHVNPTNISEIHAGNAMFGSTTQTEGLFL